MAIVSLVIAWGLKYHYSNSSSDDLVWILAPTAYLVQMTGDITFERETGKGYVNSKNNIIIAPSCSGVNFMIIVFCLSVYIGIKKIRRTPIQFLWLVLSIVSSYLYTLIVNTFRISLSIYSIRTEFLQSLFSGETVPSSPLGRQVNLYCHYPFIYLLHCLFRYLIMGDFLLIKISLNSHLLY